MVSKYKNKTFNVPFYETQTNTHKVKIKVPPRPGIQLEARNKEFILSAYRKFITSYFPEFYSYLYDEEYFQNNCDPNSNNPNCGVNILEVAVELKETLKDLIVVESTFATSPPSNKTIVILKLRYDFDTKREELENTSRMPLYQPNLDFFNQEEGISDSIDQTTLTVGTIGAENKLLNNGLRTFDSQYRGFEGQIDLNVDFGYMSIATTKILNILVTELTKQLRIQSPSYEFSEADTLTLFFGKKQGKLAISGINYLLIEKSIQSEPLKIGYFSIIKNNKMFQDPLTLAVLRNYQQMLTSIQGANDSKTSYSFFEFLDSDVIKSSLNATGSFIGNFKTHPKKEINNELLKVANEYGLIDVNNVDALEEGFKTSFTTEELRKLKQEVANNPDIYKRVSAAQQAKVLNIGVDVTKVIGDFLEGGPMGFASKNPQIEQLLRKLGIDELAKEAFLCMTFGMNMELGRINKAVQNSLVRSSSSIYYPPDEPKCSPINKPSIDLEMFKPFTVSGDLWKEIEKAIIDAIQQAVLEIIKKLAELLRENCDLNTPRSSDYGQNDLVDFIADNPNPENSLLPTVGAGSQLDQIAGKNGLTNEQILKYLTDLSSILSSIDICILLMNREDAPDDLLDRILEFNQTYELDIIRLNLNSISDILGFFGDLAAIVDVTDLCNQIANELYDINQDNVCLDGLGDADMQELLDLIENGLTVDIPNFDLECPDSKFLDPTITKSVPETFNALIESVQIQFISSADSAKQILLEPVLSNESRVLDSIKNAGIDAGPPINPAFLTSIINALQTVGDLDGCSVDLSDVLGPQLATALESGGAILQIFNNALNSDELKAGISGVADKINQLGDTANEGNPVFTTYKFNQNFLNKFRDYIQPDTFSYNASELSTTTENFYSSRITAQTVEGDSDNYEDLELLFKFDGLSNSNSLPPQSLIDDAPSPSEYSVSDLGLVGSAENEHYHLPTQEGENVVTHRNDLPALGYQAFGLVHDTINGVYTPGHTHPQLPYHGPALPETPESSASPFTSVFDEIPTSQEIASQGPTTEIGFSPEQIGRIPNSLSLVYPTRRGTATQNIPQLKIDFNLDRFYQNDAEDEILGGEKFATPTEVFAGFTQDGVLVEPNIFAQMFANPILESLGVESLESEQEIYYQDFPRVYGQLVENAFEYVLDNGVFDAATLQSLNFFTLTENCPPDELADFLDIQGIIDQMIEEYKESACSGEDVPLSSKIRNVIKYGMYLLMVQMHIAEIIIKNIFVMSAYNIDSILDKNSFVFTFIRGQILQSLLTYFDNVEPSAENRIRMDLTSYFNLKIQRSVVVNRGGILYTDGTVVIPSGTQFSVNDSDAFFGFDEILDFLITDRIDRSRQAINNALRKALPNTKQMSFNESMLRTLPGLTVAQDTANAVSFTLSGLAGSTTEEVLNIPETGLLMTMKLEEIFSNGETQTVVTEGLWENLQTYKREQQGLDPLPVSESDFVEISPTFTAYQMRFVSSDVRERSDNRIVVYLGLNSIVKDEFFALDTAQAMIESTEYGGPYPNAVLKDAKPKYFRSSNGAVTYYWEVKGTLDGTQSEVDSTPEEPEEPLFYRRYFKLWFKKGPNVHLLLNLGHRTIGVSAKGTPSGASGKGTPSAPTFQF